MDMLSVNMCKIAKISRCSSQKFALGYTTDTSTNLSESKEAETSQVPPSAVVGPSDELLKTLNDDDQRKLKILWMEMEVSHQSGLPVPNKMRDTEWREVLVMPTRSQRLKFYRFLCIRESRRETFKQKKLARREALEMYRQDRDASEKGVNLLEYGLNKNTLFLRLYDSSMNYTYNHWQMQAIKFGQIIVVDLGYDEHMVKRECSNCAEQIADMYGANKMNRYGEMFIHVNRLKAYITNFN